MLNGFGDGKTLLHKRFSQVVEKIDKSVYSYVCGKAQFTKNSLLHNNNPDVSRNGSKGGGKIFLRNGLQRLRPVSRFHFSLQLIGAYSKCIITQAYQAFPTKNIPHRSPFRIYCPQNQKCFGVWTPTVGFNVALIYLLSSCTVTVRFSFLIYTGSISILLLFVTLIFHQK